MSSLGMPILPKSKPVLNQLKHNKVSNSWCLLRARDDVMK